MQEQQNPMKTTPALLWTQCPVIFSTGMIWSNFNFFLTSFQIGSNYVSRGSNYISIAGLELDTNITYIPHIHVHTHQIGLELEVTCLGLQPSFYFLREKLCVCVSVYKHMCASLQKPEDWIHWNCTQRELNSNPLKEQQVLFKCRVMFLGLNFIFKVIYIFICFIL